MRHLWTALLALATTCAAFDAGAATYVTWQGEAVITAATPQCSAAASEHHRIGVGTVLKSMLRPRLLADNGNDSRVSFIHDAQSMFALDLAGGLTLPGTGTYVAYGVTGYDGTTTNPPIKANVGGQYQAFALNPPTPAATVAFVTLRGTVSNFMFINGCRVTFRASYTRRPD